MSWRTQRLPLTDDQKERGVIYSSQLTSSSRYADNSVVNEVFADGPDKERHIANLEDVRFFKSMARDMGWNVKNVIRE